MDYLAKSNEKTTAGERVPVPPPEYLPVRGLAMWKKIPYDSKHPLQHRPRMDLTFKGKELGEPLYESYPNKDFELYQGPPPNTVYDSLHDPYLRFFFRSTHVFRNLLHRGLVTLDGRVKMKLPEFNAYRRYLFRLWVFHVNQLIRQEEEEETDCYDQIFEAFEKRNPYFEDLFDDDEYFNVDTFLAQLTVRLYENEDVNTRNPLIQSLIRWLQYEERLQRNYGENYPVIRGWLKKQKRNKHMLEKKINMRRSQDNYLRARWENMKINSNITYERVTRIQEKQRRNFQMRSARRLSRARKSWARSDPRNTKKRPRIQDNLTTKAPIDKKAFQYSKNVNLGEDWDDPTGYSDDFEVETGYSAEQLEDEEILDSDQGTANMKKPPIRSADNATISQKKRKDFIPKQKDFSHAQFKHKVTKDRRLYGEIDEKNFQAEEQADENENSPESDEPRESNNYFNSHKRDDRYLNSESESVPMKGKQKLSPYLQPLNFKKGMALPHKTNRPKADMHYKPTQPKANTFHKPMADEPYKTYQSKAGKPHKTNQPMADIPHKPNQQKPGTSYKINQPKAYNSSSGKTQGDQKKISPDSKNVKQQPSKGIKSDKSSSSTQPQKMPVDKGGQDPRKTPSVKSKEKTGINSPHSDTTTPESRSSKDVQESLSEEKELETSEDKLVAEPGKASSNKSNELEHKSREGGKRAPEELSIPETMDGALKSPLTKKGILEVLKSNEKKEVPPSAVLAPSQTDEDLAPSQTDEGEGSGSNLVTDVLNKIDDHIERLDSYLKKGKSSEPELEEASKHKIEAVPKSFIKSSEQERLPSSLKKD